MDKHSGDSIPDVKQDLKAHCLENLPDALRNLKVKGSFSYEKCLDYFYTIGYYNRAFYAEKKQLTLEDTGVLDYYKATNPPERKNREIGKIWKIGKGRSRKSYSSDKLVKFKKLSDELEILVREEEAVGRLQQDFHIFRYLLYEFVTSDYKDKNDILDFFTYDLNHDVELTNRAERLAELLPNISRHINVFEENVHKIEDTIRNRIGVIRRKLK